MPNRGCRRVWNGVKTWVKRPCTCIRSLTNYNNETSQPVESDDDFDMTERERDIRRRYDEHLIAEGVPPPVVFPYTTVDEPPAPLVETAPQVVRSSVIRREENCGICLGVITDPCVPEPCKHGSFDYKCLKKWLRVDAKCPICRSPLESIRREKGSQEEIKVENSPRRDSDTTVSTSTSAGELDADSAFIRDEQTRSSRGARRSASLTDREFEAQVAARARALDMRRAVYQNQRRSLYVGSSRHSGQIPTITPQLMQRRPDLVARARVWLNREIEVIWRLPTTRLSHDQGYHYLVDFVMNLLLTIDTQGWSGCATTMLGELIGMGNASLLLHELRSFLRSPHSDSLSEWDARVQYPGLNYFPSPARAEPVEARPSLPNFTPSQISRMMHGMG